MDISYFPSGRDPSAVPLSGYGWSEIVRLLTTFKAHECRLESGVCATKLLDPAWGPYTLAAPRRADAQVTSLTGIVVDIDHASQDELGDIGERIRASGLAYVVHSTHSHRPPDDICLRLIFPLAKPLERGALTLPQFSERVQTLRREFIQEFGFPVDSATNDVSRQYFLPVRIEGAPVPLFEVGEGRPVDYETLLARGLSKVSLPKVELRAVPAGAEPPPVDLDAVRTRLRRVRRPESKALVDSILRGEPLAAAGARDVTVNRAASIMAGAVPELSTEGALAIAQRSIAAMPCDPEGLEHWCEKFRYSFERAKERSRALQTQRDAHAAALARLFGDDEARPLASEPIASPTASQEATATEPVDLSSRLLVVTSPDGSQRLAKEGVNAGLILEHSPEWRGALRYNLLTNEVIVSPGAPVPMISPNTFPTSVTNWLAGSDYRLVLSSAVVAEQILEVARRQAFDPVADYLTALRWDGKPRLDRFLETYLNAKTHGDERDIAPYVRAVSARWAISAVARALSPGCQVDTVLILESERQGLGKSSALKILGDPWYHSSSIDLHDNNARLAASSAWIIELAELDSFNRADKSLAKAFFTDRVDRFRPPYGRAIEAHPRRCVFVGTTNEEGGGYLTDRENRRYWPVAVGVVDLDGLARDRDQIWAEAVHRYRAGEIHYFPIGDPLWQMAAEETAARRATDDWSAAIVEWWLKTRPESRPECITTHQVALEVLSLSPAQITKATTMRIGEALRDLGFEKHRARRDGQRAHLFFPPAELKAAAQQSPTVSTAASTEAIAKAKVPK